MSITNPISVIADINSGTFGTLSKKVTQGDNVSLTVSVNLSGAPFPLTNITQATLVTTRLDRKTVVDVGRIVEYAQIVFNLSREATAISGSARIVIQLYDEGLNRVSTIGGTINIEKDPTGESYAPLDGELTLIKQVLGDGPSIIEAAQLATIAALEAAEKANNAGGGGEGAGDIDGGHFGDESSTNIDGGVF